MKNLTLFAIIALFFISCGKEGIAPKEEEIVTGTLNISRSIFSLNSILQKKHSITYVSLRYWKEENINSSDDISLTVNGASATLIKKTSHNVLTGTDALFQIPAININGDVKATYSIKSGNKTYSGEKTLRYVDDYEIATIWDKLNKDYVLQNPHLTAIQKDGSFQVLGGTVTPEPLNLGIGMYGTMRTTAITLMNPILIAGLNGAYGLRYDSNRNLNAIVVILGNEDADQSFDKIKTLDDITSVYGIAVMNILGNKVYSKGAFDIEINTSAGNMQATIKKVR